MHRPLITIAGTGVVAADGVRVPDIEPHQLRRGCDDESLKAHIGRRGIRYKDRATRLALVSSRLAMADARLVQDGYADLDDARFAVAVSSCFGNVDTVLRCAAQIAEEGASTLSPMDLPNASANVVAATLAIWFGLRGANLFFAGVDQAGCDALLFGSNLIQCGLADRVLVCGAESAQPALTPLFERSGAPGAGPIDISAALVLERADEFERRTGSSSAIHLTIGHTKSIAPRPQVELAHPVHGRRVIAPDHWLGEAQVPAGAYGAAGLLRVIAECRSLIDGRAREPVATLAA